MMLLDYNPSTAKDLPYYDRNPLIFVLEVRSTYLIGLNMHYLDPSMRRRLLDALIQNGVIYIDDEDDQVILKMRYANLESFISADLASVCIRKYYTRNSKNWMIIPTEEWQNIINLPLEKFVNKGTDVIWADSRRKIQDYGKK